MWVLKFASTYSHFPTCGIYSKCQSTSNNGLFKDMHRSTFLPANSEFTTNMIGLTVTSNCKKFPNYVIYSHCQKTSRNGPFRDMSRFQFPPAISVFTLKMELQWQAHSHISQLVWGLSKRGFKMIKCNSNWNSQHSETNVSNQNRHFPTSSKQEKKFSILLILPQEGP